MLVDQIKAGDIVEITLHRSDGDNSYSSRVEEKLGKEMVLLNTPVSQGEYVKLRLNEKCSIIFMTDKFMILYEGIAVKSFTKDGFSYILFRICSKGERLQRRRFVRHDCSVQFSFSIIKKNHDDPVNDVVKFEATTKDISGGGIKFVASTNFDESHSIKIYIKLEKENLLLFGRIVSKNNLTRTDQPFQYSVEFENLSNSDRDAIMQFIFNEQRRSFKKARA